MTDPSNDAPHESVEQLLPPAEIAPPQLRLHHFFALTAVMAVLLAISGPQRNFENLQYQPSEPLRTFQLVFGVLYQIPVAVAVTALAYGIAAYRRGQLFFNQPGHWLLVEISLTALLSVPPTLLYRWVNFTGSMQPGDTPFMLIMIASIYSLLFLVLCRMVINIYLGITRCRQRRWKSVFYGKAVASLIVGLGDIAVIVLLISAMRTDRREQLLRNSGHRCGTYVQLLQSALIVFSTLFGVLSWFLFWPR